MVDLYIPSCLKWQFSFKYVNYVFCEQENQWSGGTDGRTDTVLIVKSLSTGSATC